MAHKYQTGLAVGTHQYVIECLIRAITMYAVCACVKKRSHAHAYIHVCMYKNTHSIHVTCVCIW